MRGRTLAASAGLAAVAIALSSSTDALAAAPIASFLWFPTAPSVGEQVSLASTSTDAASPILGFSWDLAGDGAFIEGGVVASTTFSTPGEHIVRLLVSAADGSSSVAEEQIPVSSPPLAPMLPAPVVRIAGAASRSGTRVRLLSVEAPPGAQISVECHGPSCPVHYASQATPRTGSGTSTLGFRRLERTLRPGTILEVRVSKSGSVGKYTRFTIRRGRAPARIDACLDPGAIAPTPCPS